MYEMSGAGVTEWAKTAGAHFLCDAALDRLLLPRLLPEVDRVLYIDADCIALRPLENLFSIDNGENGIAASSDDGVWGGMDCQMWIARGVSSRL